MKTSAEKLFEELRIYYQNIYNLLLAYNQAGESNDSEDIVVPFIKPDGSVVKINIKTFQKLQQELNRLDNNFKSLTNADNISYIVNGDGSLSQYTKTSFMNAEYINTDSVVFDKENCIVDTTSTIEDLVFPSVKLPIEIDSSILRTNVHCKIFEITYGWEALKDIEDLKIIHLEQLFSTGKIKYSELTRTIPFQKEQIKYFGKFNVETVKQQANNEFRITLNEIKYTALNSIGDSISLNIGDLLVNKRGTAKFQITYIDRFQNIVDVVRIAGSDIIKVGIDELFFNEIVDGNKNIINIPIKPNKKLVVFLSTESNKNISFPSNGLKIDTTEYKLTYQSKTYTIDEFFSKYVTNFTDYLNALASESTIPNTLGIQPDKPNLLSANFKVIQINKHITTEKTIAALSELEKNKQSLQNDIDFKQTQINNKLKEIDSYKFNSADEKSYTLNVITKLRNEINVLKTNLLAVAREIDSNAIKNGIKNTKPKYRIIGFWDIQDDIYSPETKAQKIIKYEVQYRYLSKNIDVVSNTSFTMISKNREISVVFSPWNILDTRSLNKVMQINGELDWEEISLDSADDININQLNISISEGESVEIRVRALSEAGYPLSPVKSDWSEILRVDFPSDLTENNVSSIVSKNDLDLANAEFNQLLINAGVMNHVSEQIKESEKTYMHPASSIASGQYTSELKHISTEQLFQTLINRINVLEKNDVTDNIVISFIDFNNERYTITNNTTLDVFGGNYTEDLNLLDTERWGTIIRKRGYIQIKNNNTIPIELKSLVPGVQFDATTGEDYYNVPVKMNNRMIQDSKQVIYFRNKDITGQTTPAFALVVPKKPNTKTYPNETDIEISTVADKDKNVVYLDKDGIVKLAKMKKEYNTDFVAFTTDHPIYNYDNKDLLIDEIKRLSYFTENIKAPQYQSEAEISDMYGLGFSDNDFYAIGQNTCGAFLYPLVPNVETISVVGNTTTSTLIIQKESELLIPIVFEFRMIDRLGNTNGQLNYDPNVLLEYSKKVGIDLMINNSKFKFDLNVTARLKSKININDKDSIKSVTAAFNNENKEKLS